MLEGDTGLLFTNSSPKVVIEWFEDFTRDDYARKGTVATETVEVPEGAPGFLCITLHRD